MHIGVLGGTGPAGKGLALRLADAGLEVVIGSRSAERAVDVCRDLKGQWADRHLALHGADNAGAAAADVVVVATPWDAAASTARTVASLLDGKVVVCMANALTRVDAEFEPLVPPRGSVAAHVQSALPGSLVSAAFHHLPAKELGAIDHPMEGDVLVCSDHKEASQATCQLVEKIDGLRALDAGSLANATPIEAFTAVLLQLNVRYKTRAGLRLTGITKS